MLTLLKVYAGMRPRTPWTNQIPKRIRDAFDPFTPVPRATHFAQSTRGEGRTLMDLSLTRVCLLTCSLLTSFQHFPHQLNIKVHVPQGSIAVVLHSSGQIWDYHRTEVTWFIMVGGGESQQLINLVNFFKFTPY